MALVRIILPVFFCMQFCKSLQAQQRTDTSGNKTTAGLLIKDTDGDGVNDEEDKCPNERGPVSSFGCPNIISDPETTDTLIRKCTYFKTGYAELLPISVKVVEMVINVLNENPHYKVALLNYANNNMHRLLNVELFNRRMQVIRSLLLAGGIDKSRIELNEPVSLKTNDTKIGNRTSCQVEIQLYYKRH